MQKKHAWLPNNHKEIIAEIRKVVPSKQTPNDNRQVSTKRAVLSSGLEKLGDSLTKAQKTHLLKRTLFGLRSADREALNALDLDESLAVLFAQHPVGEPINDYENTSQGILDPDVPLGETWVEAAHSGELEGQRTISLKSWLVNNMVNQPTSLEEKMILFWHNLLPIQTWDVFYGKLSYQYFQMLRKHVFGNYKELIKALTLDQAMLFFLNGTFNSKEAPDENYARELQELFCIGKGSGANFTEQDVQSAAKVLTGWVVNWQKVQGEGTTESIFYAPLHDESDKQFSAFYGDRVIIGRSGSDGAQELDELLDMIFDNSETALYICRRVYQFFVYSEIDEQAERDVIVPLANIFRENDYEIEPVLRTLLSSAHFYDEANVGAMIKAPTDFIIGLWKTLEMNSIDTSDVVLASDQYESLLWRMASGGMEIGDPPSVSGWPAYYQAPSFDKYWITTDTIASRASTTDSLIYWGFWVNADAKIKVDLINAISVLDDVEDPNKMLKNVASLLLGIELDDAVINNLKSILLAGQQTDGYWTAAWLQLQENPDDENYRMVVENRLKPTFQHMLQLGETHLM